jgi:hypothetical protein
MYPAALAGQLRDRGHDVVSIHEPDFQSLEGASDTEVCAAALADGRAILTENVPDFRRLEADALGRGEPYPAVIFTTNRQFPRGDPATIGRLVVALDVLLRREPAMVTAVFLRPADVA